MPLQNRSDLLPRSCRQPLAAWPGSDRFSDQPSDGDSPAVYHDVSIEGAENSVADSPSVLVALATYNEIENLPRLVEEILEKLPAVDVLVVDDNSPDGTGKWCDDKAAQDDRIRCVHRPGKMGLGTATVAAMQYAIRSGYDYLVVMDADFSHDPRYLPDLLAAMASPNQPLLDVAIGSRYVPGGGTEGWGPRRRLMSRCVNLYARCLLRLTPRDCSGAFRCFRTEKLKAIDFDAIRSKGYSFQEEILFHLQLAGARMGEVPIIFRDRQRGHSKINAAEAFHAVRIIFWLGMKLRFGF
jgi:dolichol-phosphate mannosyltransferase